MSKPNNNRRVSVAPNKKSKTKRDGTSPDKEEDASSNSETQRKNVIFNEEIARLQIKEEDLVNLSKRANEATAAAAAAAYQKVAVRKEIPESQRRPTLRRIGLLRRAPPDAPLKEADASAHMGPQFDDRGKLIPHSILGSPEEFYRLAVLKGQLSQEDIPDAFKTNLDTGRLSVKYARKQTPFPFPVADLAAEESNALKNWEMRMAERKRQQGYISKLLQRSPNEMVMNAGELERKLHEEKHLIDRAIPFYDNGKGYRAGSEFWKQAGRIGDEESGIHVTLTQTEKGYPPPIEHVGNSRLARNERGIDWTPTTPRSGSRRYPWKGPFYEKRASELHQVIDELDPHRPDFDNLEVVGRGAGRGAGGHATVRSRPTTAVTPSVTRQSPSQSGRLPKLESTASRSGTSQEGHAFVNQVVGPSLLFGGQPARWVGDPTTYQDTVGIEARVILETPAGRPTSQCLNIENDGTTVLFYRWKKLPKANPFGLVPEDTRRFYFDTSNGSLLPGESLHFPFIFKSDRPGLFAEQWQLETTPVVCGGARLVVTLRGIAVQEDATAGRRTELEAGLRLRTAAKIVRMILDEILDGIQIPERPRTPIDAYITEEEIFKRRNPRLGYTLDTLNQLRKLHKEAETPPQADSAADWNLSTGSLRVRILGLEEDNKQQNRREDLCGRLYTAVTRVSFGIDLPQSGLRVRQQQLCYGIVMETMDKIYNDWCHQRAIRKLPDADMEFPDPSLAAKEAKAMAKRTKSDKQKSTMSKESVKPTPVKAEQTRTSVNKERVKSPRRLSPAGGRKSSIDAGRVGSGLVSAGPTAASGGAAAAAATAATAAADSSATEQTIEEEPEEDVPTPEMLAEKLCLANIYANTYCMLGRMVEAIADACESAH